MDTSTLPIEISDYFRISDEKAGLKDVYVLEGDQKRYVFSQDTGSGWNWLSKDYVEPIAMKIIQDKGCNLIPDVVHYNMDKKFMITSYVGSKDLSDIQTKKKELFNLGKIIGQICSKNDFDGFGGLIVQKSGTGKPQHDKWNETLSLLLDKIENLPKTEGRQNTRDIIKTSVEELDAENLTSCLSHGDLGMSNIRVDSSGEIIAVLDWQNTWFSDGLTEFLYRRYRIFGSNYSGQKVEKFTEGYKSMCPECVFDLSDEQATVSCLISLCRKYEWEQDNPLKLKKFIEKYGTLEETLCVEDILDPSKNINFYV